MRPPCWKKKGCAGNLDVAELPMICRLNGSITRNNRYWISNYGIWSARFGRVLRDRVPKPEANIVYDETPIQVYMQKIHQRLVREHQVSFTSLFQEGMHKSAMVGVFLAVLELARHHNVHTRQGALHSEIMIVPADGFNPSAEFTDVDDYNHGSTAAGDPASMVE